MESLLSGVSQHGYAILFAAVFLEAIGIPIPTALALSIAGAYRKGRYTTVFRHSSSSETIQTKRSDSKHGRGLC
jgi:hypothetical protein